MYGLFKMNKLIINKLCRIYSFYVLRWNCVSNPINLNIFKYFPKFIVLLYYV